MNTPSEILQKHEDANEMHLHHVDKKWVIQAMEEYAEQQVKATVKYYNGEPMEEYAKEKSEKPINLSSQQTAVEWLSQQILDNWNDIHHGARNVEEFIIQAKQIEKEQIVDAHIEGQRVFDEHPHTQWTNDQAEQYYNEAYKTNKQ